jgi:hypothetical protein
LYTKNKHYARIGFRFEKHELGFGVLVHWLNAGSFCRIGSSALQNITILLGFRNWPLKLAFQM